MKEYPPIVKVITYNNINDFFRQVIDYKGSSKIDLNDYIFRGHAYEEYKLIPTSLRPENRRKIFSLANRKVYKEDSEFVFSFSEMLVLEKFYKKSDLQSLELPEIKFFEKNNSIKSQKMGNPLPIDLHKIAALAQHYGCFTRLLDWSEDIQTALYFAITGNPKKELKAENKFIDIWCLSQENIKTLNIGKNKNKGKLFIFRPQYKGNPNLAAQKGIFSLWNPNDMGNMVDRRSLEVIINEAVIKEEMTDYFKNKKPIFYLFKIPKKYIRELYKYLSSTNCTASKFFPGYTGVAKEINEDSLYLL